MICAQIQRMMLGTMGEKKVCVWIFKKMEISTISCSGGLFTRTLKPLGQFLLKDGNWPHACVFFFFLEPMNVSIKINRP